VHKRIRGKRLKDKGERRKDKGERIKEKVKRLKDKGKRQKVKGKRISEGLFAGKLGGYEAMRLRTELPLINYAGGHIQRCWFIVWFGFPAS
jgi:hypothetical protein